MTGTAGNDRLDGGPGADTMTGLGGDDTYVVDNPGDKVIEAAGGGNDTVLTTTSYALGAGQEIETLAVDKKSSTAAVDLTGNAFANTLRGDAGDNVFNGGGGNDTITTYDGMDTVLFTTALASAGNVVSITDFSTANDRIELSHSVFGAPARGVNAHHLAQRHREHAERIVRPQVVLGREREAREVRERPELAGMNTRGVELRPVVRHPLIHADERRAEPLELESAQLVGRRKLGRRDIDGEAAVSHAGSPGEDEVVHARRRREHNV